MLRELNTFAGVGLSVATLEAVDLAPPTVDERTAWLLDLRLRAPLGSVTLGDWQPYRRRPVSTVWQSHPSCAHWPKDGYHELIGSPLLGNLCRECVVRWVECGRS